MKQIEQHNSSLPHHKLQAYGKALELLAAVRAAHIRDAKLRDEARRAAKGTCLNLAEGAGRFSPADKARAYAIARGECVEAVAATEIAVGATDAVADVVALVVALGDELYRILGALVR